MAQVCFCLRPQAVSLLVPCFCLYLLRCIFLLRCVSLRCLHLPASFPQPWLWNFVDRFGTRSRQRRLASLGAETQRKCLRTSRCRRKQCQTATTGVTSMERA